MPQDVPVFAAPYAPPDETLAQDLLAAKPSAEGAAATQDLARKLLALTRARRGGIGGVEDFLHEFALSSREGLAVLNCSRPTTSPTPTASRRGISRIITASPTLCWRKHAPSRSDSRRA